jgi:redox-sensitive bicupin YhaK (pirin superfamily)
MPGKGTMSDQFQEAATCERTSPSCDALRAIVRPQEKDLGGFSVRRLMPSAQLRSVGPFIFFDHLGPARFPPGAGIDVRPHPHIGLATVTYLFEGEILHRDSIRAHPASLYCPSYQQLIPNRY